MTNTIQWPLSGNSSRCVRWNSQGWVGCFCLCVTKCFSSIEMNKEIFENWNSQRNCYLLSSNHSIFGGFFGCHNLDTTTLETLSCSAFAFLVSSFFLCVCACWLANGSKRRRNVLIFKQKESIQFNLMVLRLCLLFFFYAIVLIFFSHLQFSNRHLNGKHFFVGRAAFSPFLLLFLLMCNAWTLAHLRENEREREEKYKSNNYFHHNVEVFVQVSQVIMDE